MAFYTTSSQSMMMNGASARQAASASCAYSTEMSRASMMNIALILDATTNIAIILDVSLLLASIIICALIPLAILVSVLAVALFVLVLVLLAAEYHHTPRSRRGA